MELGAHLIYCEMYFIIINPNLSRAVRVEINFIGENINSIIRLNETSKNKAQTHNNTKGKMKRSLGSSSYSK